MYLVRTWYLVTYIPDNFNRYRATLLHNTVAWKIITISTERLPYKTAPLDPDVYRCTLLTTAVRILCRDGDVSGASEKWRQLLFRININSKNE